MDFTLRYCTERRSLEERNWSLVSRLAVLTDRLMRLVGVDREGFVVAKAMCADARDEVVLAREYLAQHRASHGC